MPTEGITTTNGSKAGTQERQISRGVVEIYKDYTGRGPTYAKTTISEFGCITILKDSLTKAERRLVELGRGEEVRRIRRTFQEAMRDEICELARTVTDRECGTLLSDHHPEDDVAIESVMFQDLPPSQLD